MSVNLAINNTTSVSILEVNHIADVRRIPYWKENKFCMRNSTVTANWGKYPY